MVILGIALSGLFPLAAMHSRAMQALEQRNALSGQWYLAPSTEPWARKLGAPARLLPNDPGPLAPAIGETTNAVQVLSFERSFLTEEITVRVSVVPVRTEAPRGNGLP